MYIIITLIKKGLNMKNNGRVIAQVGDDCKDKLQKLANSNSNGNITDLLRMLADGKEIKR